MSRIRRSGSIVLAAVLGACGSGGGGGDGAGCPAGSILTVFPTTARVTAGTAAISFGGGVSNCAEEVHWTLSGPGRLDRSAGVPVLYTPPASVAAMTTATLTATVAGLSASATITIDPAILVLAGRVIGTAGGPIAGATVRVGTATATTGVCGDFSLPGVGSPYDAYATAPGGLLTSVYPGLRRMDPTLVLFDEDLYFTTFPSGGSLSALVAGALSGGAGFPEPAGHEAGIAFRSAEAFATGPVSSASSTYLLGARWCGPPSTTGALHVLQWLLDGDGFPVTYDGHASRGGVTLTDGATATGQDLTLGSIATSSLSGSIGPAGASASISLFADLGGGARVRILPRPSEPSPFAGFGSGEFGLATPAIEGATIDVVARQEYAGWAFQEVHRHGLAPDASGVSLTLGGLPIQNTPVNGTTIGPGATFTWYAMPDSPVYVVAFRGPMGSPGFDVFTGAQVLTIPPELVVPAAATYTWRVRGSSAFSTVEDAAGPGGFLAPAASYRIAQSDTWTVVTPP